MKLQICWDFTKFIEQAFHPTTKVHYSNKQFDPNFFLKECSARLLSTIMQSKSRCNYAN
uniref:Uncharacterized protein n=1 Tax=Arundo donax TaxID=35708 RepID=A0A0A8XPW3_ARUDO